MAKRAATSQLTADNWEDEIVDEVYNAAVYNIYCINSLIRLAALVKLTRLKFERDCKE